MIFLKEIFKNQLVRYFLVLLVGVGLGAVFYPTSHIETKLHKKYEEETKTLVETHNKEIQSIESSYSKETEELKSFKLESEKKVQSLTTQIQTLQSKQKTSYYKLIKPDGTIEVKKFSESEVNESSTIVTQIQEEFKTKIASIEEKWETIHKSRVENIKKDFNQKEEVYKKKIEELEQSKLVIKNGKTFGVEGGYSTERRYYLHGTGDLYGPLFIGIHSESDVELDKKSLGLGLGIKF